MKFILILSILLSGIVNAKEKTESKKQFIVKSKISEDDDLLSTPSIVLLEGKEATISVVTEKYLPQDWEIDQKNMLPKPVFDEASSFGIIQKISIDEAEYDGQTLILLHGELILRSQEKQPEVSISSPQKSTKNFTSFEVEKKVRFAFDMTSRDKVSYTFKEGKKTYKVDIEISEVIREKPKK